MSDFKQPAPFLNISTIKALKAEIVISGGGEGWLLSNRLPNDRIVEALGAYFDKQKVGYQCECILDRVEELYMDIKDFAEGNWEKREQEYIRDNYVEDDDEIEPFDPHKSLEYYLTTDGISDLPDQIGRFSDLLRFVKTFGIRQKAMHQAFADFFGNALMPHYKCKTVDGDTIMVPENQMPTDVVEDIKLHREVKEEREAIEFEFCFDNYDEWLRSITQMVSDRRPFTDMLTLFKC